MPDVYESGKLNSGEKKLIMVEVKQNVLEACRSKNLTRAKRYPLRLWHYAKCLSHMSRKNPGKDYLPWTWYKNSLSTMLENSLSKKNLYSF